MKKTVLLSILFFVTVLIHAQPNPAYQVSGTHGYVQAKNYPLLTMIEDDAAASALLASDPQLSALKKVKADAITSSQNCKDVGCFIEKDKLSSEEIAQVSARLKALYKTGNALDKLIKTKLIPPGSYSLYKASSPSELLIKAWEQDATGINHAIDIYAAGAKPNYPLIDSISFNVKAASYPATVLYNTAVVLSGYQNHNKLFFEPSMQAALIYMEINDRHDAANYEPMQSTVNKAAFDAVKTTKWTSYPYSVILVPGAGGNEQTKGISPGGMLRCRLAAQQYQEHLAPFIIVSGGKVHPYKTLICEAEEMKRFMVETLHIPASAIIMDPHARHTTTNVRNAARLMFRYGMPMAKPGLVISDKSQTDYIATTMIDRCIKELKYVPYKVGKRISDTALEFYGVTDALQVNPDEPLDP